jgi:two-component system phosphate regulon sensor histidine kinase PhoR
MNNPEEAKRFLGILSNQADRLNTIVEDLLVLSKIEFDVGKNAMDFTEGSVNHVLDSAIEACILNATRKNITIERCYENPIIARMEPNLLEQAVVNLVDNAINYSENGRHIWINAVISEDGKETIISVKDEGFGIAREHLDRLFERFYRVDKARSRKLGGTGLGLSIVKHIALAHGGRVEVESAPGKGSVFFIYLPRV